MRINVRLDPSEIPGVDALVLTDRVRWAFGSYSSEIRGVRVRLASLENGFACTIHVRLRGQREVQVATEGRTSDEAIDFAAGRARAAVARRFEADRMTG